MKDYLSAVDYMKKESYIDTEHIGAAGASYGGFSVYWLAGHHEGRFAALIAHAGIFNFEAQYLETEEMFAWTITIIFLSIAVQYLLKFLTQRYLGRGRV